MSAGIIINLLLALTVLFLIDLYAFQAVSTSLAGLKAGTAKIIKIIYWIISIGLLLWLLVTVLTFSRSTGPKSVHYLLFGTVILFLVPKLIIIVMLLGEDIFRILRSGWMYVYDKIYPTGGSVHMESRRTFISRIALAIAAIPFASILYGITKGKYNFKVHSAEIFYDDLPEEFDGFKVVQLSDFHAGSLDNHDEIQRGLDIVAAQKADVILFTGDLVNNLANEISPFVSMFSRLQAPYGKFSVLGNHDYADYVSWPSLSKKKINMEELFSFQEKMGFRLLKNESVKIQKGNASISIIGVENWGTGGFAKYGDLEKSISSVAEKDFKILMSHDPSHWEAQVIPHNYNFNLTLSGHTHGMQFGIEIPGFKWSPVKYRYPRWAGLYKEHGQYLYVNRGFGFIGFPGRVGIWPEITVLTLRKKA